MSWQWQWDGSGSDTGRASNVPIFLSRSCKTVQTDVSWQAGIRMGIGEGSGWGWRLVGAVGWRRQGHGHSTVAVDSRLRAAPPFIREDISLINHLNGSLFVVVILRPAAAEVPMRPRVGLGCASLGRTDTGTTGTWVCQGAVLLSERKAIC